MIDQGCGGGGCQARQLLIIPLPGRETARSIPHPTNPRIRVRLEAPRLTAVSDE
jgi:hypothetical protein